jgi:hypothetical protein
MICLVGPVCTGVSELTSCLTTQTGPDWIAATLDASHVLENPGVTFPNKQMAHWVNAVWDNNGGLDDINCHGAMHKYLHTKCKMK